MPEVYLVGTGACLPDHVVSNKDLESKVDTSDDWIVTRTGIRERRIAPPGTAASDLGVHAGRAALADAGVEASDLDLIITATTTPDHVFPSTACVLQNALGAIRAGAFDLLAACSGFVYGLQMGANAIRSGSARRVLVVGAEVLSTILNWKDRNTCVLFGDGAGAAVLSDAPGPKGGGRVGVGILGSDGGKPDFAILPAGGSRRPASAETLEGGLHTIHMRGRELFKVVTVRLAVLVEQTLKRAGIPVSAVDLMIPHQMNLRILEYLCERLPFPKDRMFVNIDRYGNTSSASVAIALDEALRTGRIRPGHRVLLVAIGGGITWASTLLEWVGPKDSL